RRHTRCYRDWSSDVCSSDLEISATHTISFCASRQQGQEEQDQEGPALHFNPIEIRSAGCDLQAGQERILQRIPFGLQHSKTKDQIGRASCRERMEKKEKNIT